MAEYYNVTTNVGDAEIANAIATNTKLDITHVAFGDGNGSVPTPNKERTSLVREVHRQAVTKYERHATNANWIVIETIIPSSIGGFWVREMGIIANGKLISHGSHAPFEKVADPSGVSEYRLRFTQNVTDGSVVELTLDESLIYATQAWIDDNYIKRSEIVDNLTTNDADKVASARTVKELQDNKLGKESNAVSATKLKDPVQINDVQFDGSTNINLPLFLFNATYHNLRSLRLSNVDYIASDDMFLYILVADAGAAANLGVIFKLNTEEIVNVPDIANGAFLVISLPILKGTRYNLNAQSNIIKTWLEIKQ